MRIPGGSQLAVKRVINSWRWKVVDELDDGKSSALFVGEKVSHPTIQLYVARIPGHQHQANFWDTTQLILFYRQSKQPIPA